MSSARIATLPVDASSAHRPEPIVQRERDSTALDLAMLQLRPLLTSEVTELCINRPGEAFIETREGWTCEHVKFADFDWCRNFAKLVGHATRQRVDEQSPLLSAALPSGERVQIVLPPAVPLGSVAIALRRPADKVWSLRDLAERGLFRGTRVAAAGPSERQLELQALLARGAYEEFMRVAVRLKLNVLCSGPTGSGKTTLSKALIREIPEQERIIAIEDAMELNLESHPNHVRLLYSKNDQGLARVSPRQLIEACLRMRPDRILLAELRGEEALDYIRNVNSGHPGSITSVHASSAALAFEQLVLLVQQSPGGRELSRQDIKELLYRLIDVVVQFGVQDHERVITEIWYEPQRKLGN
jgi:type IV secretion system protein VirB11